MEESKGELVNDNEDKYINELIGIITESSNQVNEKGNELLQISSNLITSSTVMKQKESKKVTSKSNSGLTSIQKFIGLKESTTQKSVKDVNLFLKGDNDTDLNTGIYPELKINELLYDKMKSKQDKEKLDSYVYYFFYILTKYIVKPILDNKTKKKINGLNKFLKDNIAQLNDYINKPIDFTDLSIKSKYDKLKPTFISIYTFMNDILNTPPEVMITDKKIGEMNKLHSDLLKSISSFKFD
jgi:hypothetical protein